ncbi:hypothetical protein FQA47_008382 [Oryzias melastigma]|uniref:Uncharacterized protein n=1 Tax=Oryzias melastigma TaxID=30732 RepID=A0A834FFB6_ORYME|nr:hypothetical protein FQA47_008382 [Oryzias melastigma]
MGAREDGGVHRSKAQINVSCVRKAPLAAVSSFAVVRLSRRTEQRGRRDVRDAKEMEKNKKISKGKEARLKVLRKEAGGSRRKRHGFCFSEPCDQRGNWRTAFQAE